MRPDSKVGTIEQEIIIRGATPQAVFEMIMDEAQHATLTRGEAKISRAVGGTFTTFDGWASGKQLELVKDRKIVQTWRADDWPIGMISTCSYAFSLVPAGTRIIFKQQDVPKTLVASVSKGWYQYYWKPMQKLLAKK